MWCTVDTLCQTHWKVTLDFLLPLNWWCRTGLLLLVLLLLLQQFAAVGGTGLLLLMLLLLLQ